MQTPDADISDALAALTTEGERPDLMQIDLAPTAELVGLMAAEDALVPAAVAVAAPQIAAAIDVVADRLARGGRLIYVGAGTAGRVGILDAVECPPTFGTDPDRVVAVLAGGDDAFLRSVEGAEDDDGAGAARLAALGLAADDAVVGITASGRTPFVLGAVAYARSVGAATVGIACNPGSELSAEVEHPIEVVVGAEFISGSTRLKAGTAQKLVLNMISTISMVRLGKTFGNLMIDVQVTNEKLRSRAVRIIAYAAGVDEQAASAALAEADGDTRVAIVALRLGLPSGEARRRLDVYDRDIRRTLEEPA